METLNQTDIHLLIFEKNSAKAKEYFSRCGNVVPLIGLIPYCIGIYMGDEVA